MNHKMLSNTLEFFLYFPLAMVIIFFVSLPVFYILLGMEQSSKSENAEFIITIFVLILVLLVYFNS